MCGMSWTGLCIGLVVLFVCVDVCWGCIHEGVCVSVRCGFGGSRLDEGAGLPSEWWGGLCGVVVCGVIDVVCVCECAMCVRGRQAGWRGWAVVCGVCVCVCVCVGVCVCVCVV